MKKIILASGSEGRKELFTKSFGTEFTSYISHVDESLFTESDPKELVTILAHEKNKATRDVFPNDYIFSFDTVVSCENKILGKPSSLEEAKSMLLFLNNKIQTVWTGYSFYYQNHEVFGAVSSDLTLSMSLDEIELYIQTHPVTKFAGSYAIQKDDSSIHILSGSMDIIIGAPMELVDTFIKNHQ